MSESVKGPQGPLRWAGLGTPVLDEVDLPKGIVSFFWFISEGWTLPIHEGSCGRFPFTLEGSSSHPKSTLASTNFLIRMISP